MTEHRFEVDGVPFTATWAGGAYIEISTPSVGHAIHVWNVFDYETDRPTIPPDGLPAYIATKLADPEERAVLLQVATEEFRYSK